MHSFSFLAATGLALVQPLAAAYVHSLPSSRLPVTRRDLPPTQIQLELGTLLSNTSTLFGPTDSRWTNATERYQTYAQPQVQVVVQPGQESDIAKIVEYANDNSVEFFVVNRGHSLTSSVEKFNGIQVDVRGLTGVSIDKENKTVRLQAGTYNWNVIDELWKEGYVTTTGSCLCVGMVGPALGGGHGIQQGTHGLISDNVLSLNVVLANGTEITVSEDSHADLLWAMRGAGHNFGIITSFEMNIYAAEVKEYYWKNYEFTGDALEDLFEELNRFHNDGKQDPKFSGAFGFYSINPKVSETDATILWTFIYAGPQEDAQKALEPFDKLSPISIDDGSVPYTGVSDILASGLDDELCAPNKTHIIGTAGLQAYNATVQRQLYDNFNTRVAKHPELASTRLVHEGYSVEGVLRAKPEDSAYPLRDDYLLMYFDATPAAGSGLEEFSKEWAKESVDLWNAGQPGRKPTTYVNYAAGHESLESIYGYDSWRLDRLRDLKAKYDPNNRFAWYNPIIPPTSGNSTRKN